MPSKGKRVASRQNNLRRRRHNNNRANQPAAAQPTVVAEPAAVTGTSPAAASEAAQPAPAPAPAAATQAIGRPEAQSRGRRFDRPAAYNHVGSELTRIGIFSGVLVVALVAISVVIRAAG